MYTFRAIPLKIELSLHFLSHSDCSLMKAFPAFPEGNLKNVLSPMHGFVVCLINQARNCESVSIMYGPNWGVANTFVIWQIRSWLALFRYFPSIIFVEIFLQIYFAVRVVDHFAEIQRYLSPVSCLFLRSTILFVTTST